MRSCSYGPLTWLTFDLFADNPRLVHGVFLRNGGVSEGEFSSLNFSTAQGDSEEAVETNKALAAKSIGIATYVSLHQEHGKAIVKAKPDPNLKGDVLTTNLNGLGLLIRHADCQAAIFYDPINHALSNVHCGWRGNVVNVYKETVDAMRVMYGSKPENLLVGISPSLGPNASEFVNFTKELPPQFHIFQTKPTFFDLWEVSRWQLLACGILPDHIEIAGICTYSNPQDWFSYRRHKTSGRHGTFAMLT